MSILLINSELKWCITLSRSVFWYCHFSLKSKAAESNVYLHYSDRVTVIARVAVAASSILESTQVSMFYFSYRCVPYDIINGALLAPVDQ